MAGRVIRKRFSTKKYSLVYFYYDLINLCLKFDTITHGTPLIFFFVVVFYISFKNTYNLTNELENELWTRDIFLNTVDTIHALCGTCLPRSAYLQTLSPVAPHHR